MRGFACIRRRIDGWNKSPKNLPDDRPLRGGRRVERKFRRQILPRGTARANCEVAVLAKIRGGRESRRHRAFHVEIQHRRRNARTGRRGHRALPAQGGVVPVKGRRGLRLVEVRRPDVLHEKSQRVRLRQVSDILQHTSRAVDKKRKGILRQGQLRLQPQTRLLRQIRRLHGGCRQTL